MPSPYKFPLVTVTLLAASLTQAQEPVVPTDEPVTPAVEPAVPTAEPVTPEGIPRAEPVPKAEPVTPPPEPEEPVSNLAKGPEGDLFTYANLLYSKKQYDLASRQYSRYLGSYPEGMHSEEVRYRLAESLLNLGDVTGAEEKYRDVIRIHTGGRFSGYSAYRIGALAFTREDYASALPLFRIAERNAPKPDVKLASIYYQARCLQLIGRAQESVALYEKAAESETDNPFRQKAILAIARILTEAGKKDEALTAYLRLIDAPVDTSRKLTNSQALDLANARAEALVQTGLILASNGKTEEANTRFEQALQGAGGKEWKPLARYGLIDNYYRAKRYSDVTRIYASSTEYTVPDDQRPAMMLMVANSYRFEGRHAKAVDIYLVIEQYYPSRPEGADAAFNKLICFYNLRDPSLPRFVDSFVEKQRKRDAASDKIDNALLLKAELLFKRREYERAAPVYAKIRTENIPENLRSATLYHAGFSQANGGMASTATSSLTKYLEAEPDAKDAPQALAQRALAYKDLGDFGRAIKDFDELVEKYPDSKQVELSLQQAAILRGKHTKDYPGMIGNFRDLLDKFPATKGAAEAFFWIGWGEFTLKNYKDSVAPLEEALKRDADEYGASASVLIIRAQYIEKNVDGLSKAIDYYRRYDSKAEISPHILGWLGLKQFELGNYVASERFLLLASEGEEPEKTRAEIWTFMGRARVAQDKFEEAVEAYDHTLAQVSNPAERARILLEKGQALLYSGRLDGAASATNEGLDLQRQGRINAQLYILSGDVEMARGKYSEALAAYIVPSQMFVDPKISPEAIYKSIQALTKMDKASDAAELQKQLEDQFPSYKPQPQRKIPEAKPEPEEGEKKEKKDKEKDE